MNEPKSIIQRYRVPWAALASAAVFCAGQTFGAPLGLTIVLAVIVGILIGLRPEQKGRWTE